jgi:SAM-dependent methyltransferase
MENGVSRYYDSNTGRFLRFGTGRRAHALHRELWGPGVTSAREALEHVDRLVVEELAAMAGSDVTGATTETASTTAQERIIVDFGCGVGGTLFRLAERFPRARLSGVTVSRRQVEVARRLARELGYADRCSFSHADFQTAELALQADAIVAVESFAHSDSADAFLESAARHLRPGGRLLVVDDFLAREEDQLEREHRPRVEQFRMGWRVPAVCTAEALAGAAARHGLHVSKTLDLSPLTRPGRRMRDRLIAGLAPVLVRLDLVNIPFYGNMIGGNALQIGLRERFLRYLLVVLRRTP